MSGSPTIPLGPVLAAVLVLAALGAPARGQDSATTSGPAAYFDPADLQARPMTGCGVQPRPGSPLAVSGMAVVPDSVARSNAEVWRTAGEPSLYAASRQPGRSNLRTFRLTWTPSFDPWMVVRLEEQSADRFVVTATRAPPPQSERAGAANQDKLRRPLTDAQNAAFVQALAQARLADLPAPDNCTPPGYDGPGWALESLTSAGYRFRFERSPQGGALRDLGELMLDFTGWPTRSRY